MEGTRVKTENEIVSFSEDTALRAERRLGELLRETPKAKGTRLGGNVVLPPDATPTLAELGISKMESSRWQAHAAEIALRAARRIGELQRVAPKAKGGQPYRSTGASGEPVEPTLADQGITKKQSMNPGEKAASRACMNSDKPRPRRRQSLGCSLGYSLDAKKSTRGGCVVLGTGVCYEHERRIEIETVN